MDIAILLGILRGSCTISTVSQCLRHFPYLPWCARILNSSVLTRTMKYFSTALFANSNQPFYWRWSNCSVLLSFKCMCVSIYRCMCAYTCVYMYRCVHTCASAVHMLKLKQRKTRGAVLVTILCCEETPGPK